MPRHVWYRLSVPIVVFTELDYWALGDFASPIFDNSIRFGEKLFILILLISGLLRVFMNNLNILN